MDLPIRGYQHCSPIFTSHGHTLFIGDLSSAEDEESLRAKNIHTVISAVQGYEIPLSRDFKHHTFHLEDTKSQNIAQYLDEADKLISAGLKTGGVLVHCAAGVSRSPTLVIAYLIKSQKMTFHQALKLCKNRRPEVCPNLGFERQLKAFEKGLKDKEKDDKSTRIRNLLKEHIENSNTTVLPELTKHHQISRMLEVNTNLSGIGNIGGGGVSRLTNRHAFFELRETRRLTPMQKRQNYLRQMAQFRFGITSLGKFTDNRF